MKKVSLFIIVLLLAVSFGCSKEGEQDEIKVKNVEEKKLKNQKSEVNTKRKAYDVEKKNPQQNFEITKKGKKENTPQKIKPSEANSFVGKSVIVEGYVASVFVTDKVAYLNFEKKYPDNPLAATVFEKHFSDFDDLTKYENRTVEIKGRVTKYKGKPQIILNSDSQIRIVE